MVDFEKLNANLKRYKQFQETELGKLFCAYRIAVIDYWRHDANYRISDKRILELSDKEQETEHALVEKLMELANV